MKRKSYSRLRQRERKLLTFKNNDFNNISLIKNEKKDEMHNININIM